MKAEVSSIMTHTSENHETTHDIRVQRVMDGLNFSFNLDLMETPRLSCLRPHFHVQTKLAKTIG